MTPGKKRQADYRARMLAEGRRQYAFWLTDEQAQTIRTYLVGDQSLPTGQAPEPAPPERTPELETPPATPAPPEADIRLMRDQGLSWRAIAKALNEKGVPPADGMRKWTGPDLMRIYG